MSVTPASAAETTSPMRTAPAPCLWRSWPLAERGWRRCLLPGVILAASVFVELSTEQPGWAVAIAVLLAIAAWRYFVPVVYELGTLGITQQVFSRQRRFPWRSFGGYEIRSTGVFLSPHADRGPFDAFGGLYLPWCNHREDVLANVEFYLAGRYGQKIAVNSTEIPRPNAFNPPGQSVQ